MSIKVFESEFEFSLPPHQLPHVSLSFSDSLFIFWRQEPSNALLKAVEDISQFRQRRGTSVTSLPPPLQAPLPISLRTSQTMEEEMEAEEEEEEEMEGEEGDGAK